MANFRIFNPEPIGYFLFAFKPISYRLKKGITEMFVKPACNFSNLLFGFGRKRTSQILQYKLLSVRKYIKEKGIDC